MYLTYDQYSNMGGTLDETVFNELEMQAEMYVNKYTFNRLKEETTYPPQLANLVFSLISLIDSNQNTILSAGNITSQSNDGVTTKYNSMSSKDIYTHTLQHIENTIKLYLNGVKNSKNQIVLYRGIYEDDK